VTSASGQADRALVTQVRDELRAAADPGRAPGMQAYMKSAMPYLGVPRPEVRRITGAAASSYPPASIASLGATATLLWREAAYREERYVASELTALPMAQGAMELLPLYREIIVTGAWWDHVDGVAHRISNLLLAHPDQMRPVIQQWSIDPDLWLRRSSIICQVGARAAVDERLLSEVILANAADRDFFIRKAIGWALRDHARIAPDWVRAFLAQHEEVLSPLSRREAAKHLSP
jgi:3-methyladenine DNA glycosylase AlkD